jgi:hypothetical protein
MIERERRMIERRIKEARFPTVKSLDSFDFTAKAYACASGDTICCGGVGGDVVERRANMSRSG